jgi:peptide/nickel transport system ATP-binding protein
MKSAESSSLLEIQGLVVCYSTARGDLRAVDRLDLAVYKGEVIGVVGESACGKSTLALTLLKALPAPGKVVGGSIKVNSVDIGPLIKDELQRYRWEKVAMIFQFAMNALDPVKTIESQMTETIVQHKRITKEQAKIRVRELLEMVDLDHSVAKSYPHELSGGMRQRVVIAMALCLDPDLLVADEPTTALDVVVQAGVLQTLKYLRRKLGLTVILISHDVSIMWEMSDRLAVMYAGKIVELGSTKEIIEKPQHPYTEALLNAVPVVGKDRKEIRGIPGAPPDLISPPSGCRFHPRCPYAFRKCELQEPPLMTVDERQVACWLREQ